jgi:hypothetical protein
MKKFLCFVLFLLTAASYPDSEGPNHPVWGENVAFSGEDWVFPTLAFDDDSFYATASNSSESRTNLLRMSDFGFSVPAGSTIDGIEVMIDRSASAPNTVDDRIVELFNDSSGFDGTSLANNILWPTADTFVTYGSSTNLWGMEWTIDDVNAASFSVYISANIPGSVEARIDAVWITVYFTLNGVPSASALQVSPAMPSRSDDLMATYTYTDPETDPESGSQIRWYKDNVLQTELNDLGTVQSIKTDFNEVWHFTVRPSDGFGLGTLLTSPGVQITNNTPSAANALISPDPPGNSQTLILSYDFNDPDGDPESGTQIVWYKDTIQQTILNDSLTVPDVFTNLGEVWFAAVRPSDGLLIGNIVTSPTVTISNILPEATGLWLNHSTLDNPVPLVAQYSYSDFDGDLESGTRIRWFKNHVHQLDLLDSPSVPIAKLFLGDSWFFTVEPSDGSDFGTVKQSNVISISASMPIKTLTPNLLLIVALLFLGGVVIRTRLTRKRNR